MYAFDRNFSFLWQNLINNLILHQHFGRLNDFKYRFGPQFVLFNFKMVQKS